MAVADGAESQKRPSLSERLSFQLTLERVYRAAIVALRLNFILLTHFA